MLKKLHLFIGILVTIILLIFHSNLQVNAEEKTNIKITGVIKNIKDAKKYLLKDSYLFLMEKNTNPKVSIFDFGRIMIIAEGFPKTDIAENGSFDFKIEHLIPGKYLILCQPIQGFTLGPNHLSHTFILHEKTDEAIEIEISKKDNKSIKLNLGEVIIKCPKMNKVSPGSPL